MTSFGFFTGAGEVVGAEEALEEDPEEALGEGREEELEEEPEEALEEGLEGALLS